MGLGNRRLVVLALAAGPLALAACGTPTLAECVDEVDPRLRERGYLPQDPSSLELEVEPNVVIMTVNVGNGELQSGRYALRLSFEAYEAHLADEIQAIRPDIVALQEVLPRRTCVDEVDGEEVAWEVDDERTCIDQDIRDDQVRRLLGPGYSIVCDRDTQVDCLAVHTEFGSIVDVEPGGYDRTWADTLDLPPLPTCDYPEGECHEKVARCDAESSVFTATLEHVSGTRIEAVHVHPAAFGQACRERQFEDAFAALRQAHEDAPDTKLMMLGDWNTDPDRLNRPIEEALYYAHVGPGRLLREHDERDEACARVKTSPLDIGTFDRVTTDFAFGFCEVLREGYVPVGQSSPRKRLDADFEEWELFPQHENDEGRMDHSAVVCRLFAEL